MREDRHSRRSRKGLDRVKRRTLQQGQELLAGREIPNAGHMAVDEQLGAGIGGDRDLCGRRRVDQVALGREAEECAETAAAKMPQEPAKELCHVRRELTEKTFEPALATAA